MDIQNINIKEMKLEELKILRSVNTRFRLDQ